MAKLEIGDDQMWFFSLPSDDPKLGLYDLLDDPGSVVGRMESGAGGDPEKANVRIDPTLPVTIIVQYDLRRGGSYLVQGEVKEDPEKGRIVAGNVITLRAPRRYVAAHSREHEIGDGPVTVCSVVEIRDGEYEEGQTYIHLDLASAHGGPTANLTRLVRNPWQLKTYLESPHRQFFFGDSPRQTIEGYAAEGRGSGGALFFEVHSHPVFLIHKLASAEEQRAAARAATGTPFAAKKIGPSTCVKFSGPHQTSAGVTNVEIGMMAAIPW